MAKPPHADPGARRGLGRREFLEVAAAGAALAVGPIVGGESHAAPAPPSSPPAAAPRVPPFAWDEATLADLQAAMSAGKATSAQLTRDYLARADAIDRTGPTLRALLDQNPDALAIAEALDRERKKKGARGPLHGVPILVKDNLDVADKTTTTAGSLALEGSIAARDAFVVERLRAAGAVLLGKTNLSEWANIRSARSSSGWSARGGQCRNPYALDRSPIGSSSGSAAATAANLCAMSIGTETDGSITAPAAALGLVGLKPTVGLLSRSGVIPVALSQDTPGPLARTVRDAAILLGAMTGVDPRDPATASQAGKAHADYTKFLDGNGLKGARIGVGRKLFGAGDAADRLIDVAIADLKRLGATVIDPAEIATVGKFDELELDVLLWELKDGLNRYLGALAPSVKVRSLKDVIEFNRAHAAREMPFFGQDLFEKAEAKGPLSSPEYVKARETCVRLARTEGIDQTMNEHKLDAIVAPTMGPAGLIDLVLGGQFVGGAAMAPPSVAGYPHLTVPAGMVFCLPVGLSFIGRAWSEPTLLKFGYAYEQATRHRKPPRFLATAELPT